MPIRRRIPKIKVISELSEAERSFFLDEPQSANDWTGFRLTYGVEIALLREAERQPTAAELWAVFKDEILETFIREHPAQRPSFWWAHEAPELRQQLGG